MVVRAPKCASSNYKYRNTDIESLLVATSNFVRRIYSGRVLYLLSTPTSVRQIKIHRGEIEKVYVIIRNDTVAGKDWEKERRRERERRRGDGTTHVAETDMAKIACAQFLVCHRLQAINCVIFLEPYPLTSPLPFPIIALPSFSFPIAFEVQLRKIRSD